MNTEWYLSLQLCEASGSSLGYGYSRVMSKPKSQPVDSSDDSQLTEDTLAIWHCKENKANHIKTVYFDYYLKLAQFV